MDATSENTSVGGVATLEAQTPAATGSEGMVPPPGTATVETPPATGVMADAEAVAANAWNATAPSAETGATPPPPAEGVMAQPLMGTSETAAADAKPLDAMNPLANPVLGEMKMETADATKQAYMAGKAEAQATPQKPKLVHRVLGAFGFGPAGSTKAESANPLVPQHLTPNENGTLSTPTMDKVTPEAAAAAEQDIKLSPTEMDAAMRQGALEGKAVLEPAPDATAAVSEAENIVGNAAGTNAALDEIDKTATEAMTTPDAAAQPGTEATDTATPEAATAVSEAENIVGNAAGTNAALEEIDKTATDAMTAKPETTEPESPDATTAASPVNAGDPPPPWPTNMTEPTTSGPAAASTEPTTPAYNPSPDLVKAETPSDIPSLNGVAEIKDETAAAQAPQAQASWTVDAAAPHPDAPVVGGVDSASSGAETETPPPFSENALTQEGASDETPKSMASPTEGGLPLESVPTPTPGLVPETAAPVMGMGMPPEGSGASADVQPAAEPVAAPASDILSQASQAASDAEATGGALPVAGASAPAMESVSPTNGLGDVLSQASAAVTSAEATGGALPTNGMAAPAMESVSPSLGTPEPGSDTSGTGTPPIPAPVV